MRRVDPAPSSSAGFATGRQSKLEDALLSMAAQWQGSRDESEDILLSVVFVLVRVMSAGVVLL